MSDAWALRMQKLQRMTRRPADPRVPRVITHKNMGPLLRAIENEPYFAPGPDRPHLRPAWAYRPVVLELPLGELARGGLETMALVGRARPEPMGLTGKEGFRAQGLEGKVQIRKPLFDALMNLRDIVPPHRGRILVEGTRATRHDLGSALVGAGVGGVAGYLYGRSRHGARRDPLARRWASARFDPTRSNPDAGYFVIDRFGTTIQKAIMAGPFSTEREAERERRRMNIADDCIVKRLSRAKVMVALGRAHTDPRKGTGRR